MKSLFNIRAWALGLILSFVAAVAPAKAAKFPDFSLKPLAGSEWAINNPGKLPAGDCRLIFVRWNEEKQQLEKVRPVRFLVEHGLMGFEGYQTPDNHMSVIHCQVAALGLAYELPVYFDSFVYAGVMWGYGIRSQDLETGFKFGKLVGRRVLDLFGDYTGPVIKIGAIATGRWFSLTNEHGVKFRASQLGLFDIFDVTVAHASTSIYPLELQRSPNPYLLLQDPSLSNDLSSQPAADNARQPIYRDLIGLEFVSPISEKKGDLQ